MPNYVIHDSRIPLCRSLEALAYDLYGATCRLRLIQSEKCARRCIGDFKAAEWNSIRDIQPHGQIQIGGHLQDEVCAGSCGGKIWLVEQHKS